MRAAVLREYSRPLDVTDVSTPEIGDGEVLVRVRACGVCGTDLKIVAGKLVDTPLPLIPGHEVAGEVVDGDGALPEGQRVACYIYTPCGTCSLCLNGQESICATATRIGFEEDGGFAEYIKVPARSAIPFADHVPFEAAAVAMDAVLTPWRALHVRARVQPGETVVVSGAGGLGLNAVQIARHAGARVAVVDPVPAHRDEAMRVGAEVAVDPQDAAQLREWSGNGGVDVGIEAAGKRAGFDALVAAVRDGSRIVLCGYEIGQEYGMDARRFALQEMVVMGSRAGTLEDAKASLRAVEEGAVSPTISERLELDQANEALALLGASEIVGRLVIEI